jgi:hypothetical protein
MVCDAAAFQKYREAPIVINNVFIQNSVLSNSQVQINPISPQNGDESPYFMSPSKRQTPGSLGDAKTRNTQLRCTETLLQQNMGKPTRPESVSFRVNKCRSANRTFIRSESVLRVNSVVSLSNPEVKKMQLSDYKPLHPIGVGHFGQVFKAMPVAETTLNAEPVAIKVIKLPRTQTKQKLIEHLFNERKCLQAVQGNSLFAQLKGTILH